MDNFGVLKGLNIFDENFNKIEILVVNDNPNNLSLESEIGSLSINRVDGKIYRRDVSAWVNISDNNTFDIFDFKSSVIAATTESDGNINLTNYTGTIDGVSLVNNGRYLIKNQTDKKQNGIYVYSSNSFIRSSDADEDVEVSGGMVVPVSDGVNNKNTLFILANADPIELGVTELEFLQIGLYKAGQGINIVDNVINILLDNNSGLKFVDGKLSINVNESSIVKNIDNEIEVRGYKKIIGVIDVESGYKVIDSIVISNSNTVNWVLSLKKSNAIFCCIVFATVIGNNVDYSVSNVLKIGINNFIKKPNIEVIKNGNVLELRVTTDNNTEYFLRRELND